MGTPATTRFYVRPAAAETDAGLSARCGRCADILPDETLTFCPACGVPFSQVPPTQTYHLLSDRREQRAKQWARFRQAYITTCGFLIVLLCYALMSIALSEMDARKLSPAPRHVAIYTYDIPGYPELSSTVRRTALGVAVQAYQDHFGISLGEISIHENQLPPQLTGLFDPNAPREKFTQLHFWERSVFPALTRIWSRNPQGELPVLISNFPVFVGNPNDTEIETQHLSSSGVVSGLGHPSLVLVSTYRIANRDQKLDRDRPDVHSEAEQIRYLGEYLLAHEWGHALLGLEDYVTDTGPALRAPASLPSALPSSLPAGISSESPHFANAESGVCLMHTDRGGGFQAWSKIRARELGQPSRCRAYDAILENFHQRSISIALLRDGQRSQAAALHARTVRRAEELGQGWVTRVWAREDTLFKSGMTRWWSSLFMVQSNHDQL